MAQPHTMYRETRADNNWVYGSVWYSVEKNISRSIDQHEGFECAQNTHTRNSPIITAHINLWTGTNFIYVGVIKRTCTGAGRTRSFNYTLGNFVSFSFSWHQTLCLPQTSHFSLIFHLNVFFFVFSSCRFLDASVTISLCGRNRRYFSYFVPFFLLHPISVCLHVFTARILCEIFARTCGRWTFNVFFHFRFMPPRSAHTESAFFLMIVLSCCLHFFPARHWRVGDRRNCAVKKRKKSA